MMGGKRGPGVSGSSGTSGGFTTVTSDALHCCDGSEGGKGACLGGVTSSHEGSDSTEESGDLSPWPDDADDWAEAGAVSDSVLAGAFVSVVSVSRSLLSLIFGFGLLAHLHGRSVKGPEPGDGTEQEAGDRQPTVRAELAVEPTSSEKANEDRDDKFEPYCAVVAEPLEIASHFVLGAN